MPPFLDKIVVENILAALHGMNYRPFRTEADLQSQVELRLHEVVEFESQFLLLPGCIVDLMVLHFGIAIELKIKGATSAVLSQLERYAKCDLVRQIVLVTSATRHTALASIDSLHGKPLFVVRVGCL